LKFSNLILLIKIKYCQESEKSQRQSLKQKIPIVDTTGMSFWLVYCEKDRSI